MVPVSPGASQGCTGAHLVWHRVLAVHSGCQQLVLGVHSGLPALQTRQARGLGELLGQPGMGDTPRPWSCRQAGTTPATALGSCRSGG